MLADNDDKSYENFRKIQEEIMKNATETIHVKVPQKEYYQKNLLLKKYLNFRLLFWLLLLDLLY